MDEREDAEVYPGEFDTFDFTKLTDEDNSAEKSERSDEDDKNPTQGQENTRDDEQIVNGLNNQLEDEQMQIIQEVNERSPRVMPSSEN